MNDNLGWLKMVLMWDWHDLVMQRWPGWEREPGGKEPARVDLVVVKGRDRSSRELATEWDDLSRGRFYYRDWTDTGLPFVGDGEAYRSAFWFELVEDRNEFSRRYQTNRALRYAKSSGNLDALFAVLQSPEHRRSLIDPRTEQTPRLVTADALSDLGRDEEADLLRDHTKPVVIRKGKVVPADYTLYHLRSASWGADRLLADRFEYPEFWSPLNFHWVDTRNHSHYEIPVSELKPGRGHEGYAQIWNRYPELPDLHEYVHIADLGNRIADATWEHVKDELPDRSNVRRRQGLVRGDIEEFVRALDAIRSAPVVNPLPKKRTKR